MANVHDVAAYVTQYFGGSEISTMKLQKLCYIAQGWSLALRDRPLFDAQFEAWKNGPVTYDLFDRHRRQFSVNSWRGDADALNKGERIVLRAVLKKYEALTGAQLSSLTHQAGTPWSITRDATGLAEGAAGNAVIPQDLIKQHYREILGLAPAA